MKKALLILLISSEVIAADPCSHNAPGTLRSLSRSVSSFENLASPAPKLPKDRFLSLYDWIYSHGFSEDPTRPAERKLVVQGQSRTDGKSCHLVLEAMPDEREAGPGAKEIRSILKITGKGMTTGDRSNSDNYSGMMATIIGLKREPKYQSAVIFMKDWDPSTSGLTWGTDITDRDHTMGFSYVYSTRPKDYAKASGRDRRHLFVDTRIEWTFNPAIGKIVEARGYDLGSDQPKRPVLTCDFLVIW